VAALLRFGPRAGFGVFIGAFIANALRGEFLVTALGIAVGNTLGPVIAARMLRDVYDRELVLAHTQDVLWFLLITLLTMAVCATNGVVQLVLGGAISWSALHSVWPVWWLGDSLGVLVVAPCLLSWLRPPERSGLPLGVATRIEPIAWFALLCVVCQLALSGMLLRPTARIEYAVFPLAIWAALRFGPRATSLGVLTIALFAIWGAIHERGPFAAGTLDERLILLDIFLAVTALTTMTLSAITAERARARSELVRAHDELEERVRERTSALADVNAQLTVANAELSTRSRELKQKNEEVEAFVYVVSHDLRAPLVNLHGFSSELQASSQELEAALSGEAALAQRIAPIVESMRDAMRYIGASGQKFQRLIDALLALSRTGRQDFHPEELDMQQLIGTTIDSLQQLVENTHTRVTVTALPPARADRTMAGQVFGNLIGNALKYLQPGRPGELNIGGEIEVSGEFCHYWVRDNGAGIPQSAQHKLFQVFQRFHPELAPGEGMGLATVKRIVERHRGQIWAESEEGISTVFHVTLPAGKKGERHDAGTDRGGGNRG
jgi:signal transduction histidine kinase